MTEAEVFTALRSELAALTGIPVARIAQGRQAWPQPGEVYLSMRRVTNEGVGRSTQDDAGTWSQHRLLSVQVDGVGDDVGDSMTAAHALLQAGGRAADALRDAGVGVARVGALRDLTRLGAGGRGWVPVLSFDVALSYVLEVSTTPADDASGIDVGISTDDTAAPVTATLSATL